MAIGWIGRCLRYGALFTLLAVMVCSSCLAVAGEPERPEWVRFGTCAAPGDAACAGWPEDEKSIRSVKNGWDTFMYSIVYQPETGSSFGYFRKIRSGTLHFSVVTGKPSYEDGVVPVRVVRQGNRPLAVIYQSWHYGAYSIGVLDGRSYNEFALGTREPVFEDLDGDGMYETMAHKYIDLSWVTGAMEPISEFSHMVDGPLLAIYRYTPDFIRVKGKGFEKYFVAHAKELIEGKYLKWLEKGKASGMTEKVRKQLDHIVQNWLATIESTQDPEIIRQALKKLEELPYPSLLAKKATIERLVRQGYPMLKP